MSSKKPAADVTQHNNLNASEAPPDILHDQERIARAATRGPWSRCTASDGKCVCRTIWSKPLDVSPFCLAPSGLDEAVRIEDWEFVTTFDPPTVLALLAIARAAQDVCVAYRDGLRGDYEQDVHEELARALGAAGLGEAAEKRARAAVLRAEAARLEKELKELEA